MQYFMAVRLGEAALRAQERLMRYVTGSYAAMMVKEKDGAWMPVDETDLYAVVPARGWMFVVVLCDSDGYAKAISNTISRQEVDRVLQLMQQDGIKEYKSHCLSS